MGSCGIADGRDGRLTHARAPCAAGKRPPCPVLPGGQWRGGEAVAFAGSIGVKKDSIAGGYHSLVNALVLRNPGKPVLGDRDHYRSSGPPFGVLAK